MIKNTAPFGIYHDTVKTGKAGIIDYGWRKNMIVNRCRILLAAFMSGDSNSLGIRFLSLGRGDESWDETAPAPPSIDDTSLVDSSPVNINLSDVELNISYLDAANAPTAVPSNRLQLTLSLAAGFLPIAAGETSFPLREFGLFGQYDTDDFMIDYVRHPVMNINSTDTLTRQIRLVF